jgi:hypothetical protein
MPLFSPNKRLFLRSLTVANLLSRQPVKASLRGYLGVKIGVKTAKLPGIKKPLTQ